MSDAPRHPIVQAWLRGDIDAGGCIAHLEGALTEMCGVSDKWQHRYEAIADAPYAQRSREVLAFIAKFAQQMCQEDSPDPREWHDDMNYIAVIAERGTISDDQRQGADSPYVATIDPSEAQTSMAASNKTPPSPAIPAGDAHSTVRPGHPDVPVTGHIPTRYICVACDGCGWCEGSPAFKCERCEGAGTIGPNPWGLCEDCPPAAYPAPTRCLECPRRTTPSSGVVHRTKG